MKLRQITVGTILLACGAVAMLTVAVFFPDSLDPVRKLLHVETSEAKGKADPGKDNPPADNDKLSDLAHKNLNPQPRIVEKLVQASFMRTVTVPGVVVHRPGNCERLITAPVAGVIKQIYATPHDRVAPGKPLFTLEIVSEPLQTAQAGYYKTHRDLDICRDYLKQLEDRGKDAFVSQATIRDLEYQVQRFTAALEALGHELKIRGLSQRWIRKVSHGVFLTEVTIVAPEPVKDHAAEHLYVGANGELAHVHEDEFFYEMEELKTLVGEQVQAGQTLCRLVDHKTLFVEGHLFATEMAALQDAARKGLPVHAEFAPDAELEGAWASSEDNLKIRFFDNKVDPDTQTLAFYVMLPNKCVENTSGGKTYRIWRFRPGQRVQLQVPVQEFKDVIVLPAEAIVREGPETFVFKSVKGGERYDRKPVHIKYEDTRVAVIAQDYDEGGLKMEWRIVTNGTAAAQLNWVLKSKQASGGGDGDD
jgi:multidrug efflux pump subunit AcrA (membrane-fusion protein)